jgi:hypothetical protein
MADVSLTNTHFHSTAESMATSCNTDPNANQSMADVSFTNTHATTESVADVSNCNANTNPVAFTFTQSMATSGNSDSNSLQSMADAFSYKGTAHNGKNKPARQYCRHNADQPGSYHECQLIKLCRSR